MERAPHCFHCIMYMCRKRRPALGLSYTADACPLQSVGQTAEDESPCLHGGIRVLWGVRPRPRTPASSLLLRGADFILLVHSQLPLWAGSEASPFCCDLALSLGLLLMLLLPDRGPCEGQLLDKKAGLSCVLPPPSLSWGAVRSVAHACSESCVGCSGCFLLAKSFFPPFRPH